MKNKRGLSTVIATLLVILITIAAAVLIANAVIPFVKNNLAKSSECLDYKDYFKFEQKITYNNVDYFYNCYNSNLYGFSILTQGSSKQGQQDTPAPKGFILTLSDNSGNIQSAEVDNGTATNSGANGVRMLSQSATGIIIPELAGVQTYVYNGNPGSQNMEVRAVLDNGRVCDLSDSIKLIPCASNINLNLA